MKKIEAYQLLASVLFLLSAGFLAFYLSQPAETKKLGQVLSYKVYTSTGEELEFETYAEQQSYFEFLATSGSGVTATTATSNSGSAGTDTDDDDDDDDHEKVTNTTTGTSGHSGSSDLDTTKIDELEVQPETEIEVDGGHENLSGERAIKVKLEHAKRVELFLQRPGSLAGLFLGSAIQRGDDLWILRWNTNQTPNGEYKIKAKVDNIFGSYEKKGPVVSVANENKDLKIKTEVAPLPAEVRRDIITKIEEDKDEEKDDEKEEDKDSDDDRVEVTEKNAVEAEKELELEKLSQASDSDSDGLPDTEEARLGTDADNPDTDGDGYIDGLEVLRGYNPLIPSPNDKIALVQPREHAGIVRNDVYEVTSIDVQDKDGQEQLAIKGRGRPLTFVTLFIYSEEPTVVTVRTDENGNFEYSLSKTLADGDHQIYVALADTQGVLVEQSSPLSFVKTARAVTIAELDGNVPSSPASPLSSRAIIIIAVVVIGMALVMAIVIITMMLNTSKNQESL